MKHPRILHFRTIPDASGNLTPIETVDLGFLPRRVFFLHDVPSGARRGGHSHHEMQEVVIAISGSFDVVTVGENGRQRWHLNRPDTGLYLPACAWRHLDNFSSNAVALCIADTEYNPKDYVHDFGRFLGTLPKPVEDYFSRRSKTATKDEFMAVEK